MGTEIFSSSGNFTLSERKITSMKEVRKCEIASEHEVVELVWAFYMIKDGDTSLFVMLMHFMYIV